MKIVDGQWIVVSILENHIRFFFVYVSLINTQYMYMCTSCMCLGRRDHSAFCLYFKIIAYFKCYGKSWVASHDVKLVNTQQISNSEYDYVWPLRSCKVWSVTVSQHCSCYCSQFHLRSNQLEAIASLNEMKALVSCFLWLYVIICHKRSQGKYMTLYM